MLKSIFDPAIVTHPVVSAASVDVILELETNIPGFLRLNQLLLEHNCAATPAFRTPAVTFALPILRSFVPILSVVVPESLVAVGTVDTFAPLILVKLFPFIAGKVPVRFAAFNTVSPVVTPVPPNDVASAVLRLAAFPFMFPDTFDALIPAIAASGTELTGKVRDPVKVVLLMVGPELRTTPPVPVDAPVVPVPPYPTPRIPELIFPAFN